MAQLTSLVDPFHGQGEIDLPVPEGIAATWFFVKAQTGNNHPGAVLPFGMVSACPYSGAYPSGYGVNAVNSRARPPRQFESLTATGVTHIHPSGTGAVGFYYNYFRTVPLVSDLSGLDQRWSLSAESAVPGRYRGRFSEIGVDVELCAARLACAHRYEFPPGTRPAVAVDFASEGLWDHRLRNGVTALSVEIEENRAQGWMEALGVRVYVSIVFPEQGTCSLFQGRADAGGRCLSFEGADACESAGVVWRGAESGTVCEVRLGFSLKDCDDAARNVDAVRELSFAGMAGVAARVWGEVLGRIRVEGGSDTERSLFYSNLYHSLIKPMDCGNTSPLRAADRVFVTDFATLWDQYKTHLPLILTFYPETGTRIVNSLLNAAEVAGEFSNALFLNRDPVHFGDQARGLSHLVLADAFLRRLPGIDWHRALDLLVRDLTKPGNADFLDTGIARPFTHTLDLAQACFAVSWIADGLGQGEVCDRFRALARQWRNVYDLNTGILSGESEYYEGGAWNYSFRLLHDMAGRIALHGGDAAFVRDLERFFGYGEEPVPRPSDPRDGAAFDAGLALGRFEGFNNEPDMEAPYAFHYAGRPDRAAEVVRAGLRYQFASGRGGLPGNNDSGGLSSLYVWNSLGLFPVTGQPVILLGSPVFPRARLQLPGAELEIRAPETSESCIHVSGVRRNGCELERAYLTLDEFLAGGLLEFSMAECPGGWGAVQRPPSWA